MNLLTFAAWRKRMGWTQALAADRLGVSRRTIAGYEAGAPIPHAIALACAALEAGIEAAG